MVLVDQSTEYLAGLRGPGTRWTRPGDWAPDTLQAAKTEPAMRSVRVVLRGVLTQDLRQVSSTQDQHVIEDLPTHASDQLLDVAVGLWGPVRSEHDLDAFGGEDGVEAAAVLRVAVPEQETDAELALVGEIHHQVPRLLGYPREGVQNLRSACDLGLCIIARCSSPSVTSSFDWRSGLPRMTTRASARRRSSSFDTNSPS